MSQKIIAAIAFLIAAQSAHADIYRWVDDEGVTHFASELPKIEQVEAVELKAAGVQTKALDSGKHNERFEQAQADLADQPPSASALTGKAPKSATAQIDCRRAVANGQRGTKERMRAMKLQADAGRIPKARYAQMQASFRTATSSMTKANCEGAKGKEVDFYACLARDQDIMVCDRLH